MVNLNLPQYDFRIRTSGQSKEIFDALRKKFVVLTPEEWVRQNFIMYLREELKYPSGLIAVERGLTVNRLRKRTDIVIYDQNGSPWMIVECKAPGVKLTEATFYQASDYHHRLNVKYLVVTNGLLHFCSKSENGQFALLDHFPDFEI